MNLIKFDKKVTCGPEFVAVRILDNSDEMKMGNIWLPSKTEANGRLAFCKVEDVGTTAHAEYDVNVGDYVIIDRLSTFAHTAPVACLKYNNVICKTNENRSEYFPLKNMIFVEPDDKGGPTNVGGIYVNNYAEKLHTGTITKMAVEPELKSPFSVGDKVMMTKGADMIDFGETQLHIYKHDMIVAKIIEEN